MLKTVCKVKNQNWRQKNTSLCFSLNSKIQILVSDWAQLYWLLPIGYSSFCDPLFFHPKSFSLNSNSLSQTLLWTTTLPPIGHTHFSLNNSINIAITEIYISTYFLDGATVQIFSWLELLKLLSRHQGATIAISSYSLYCNINLSINENIFLYFYTFFFDTAKAILPTAGRHYGHLIQSFF